ncbi:MAG: diaminopimelate decarboxylase, partial [Caulobacter sp.]|nr:diaminopimelate decarboxylase [Caulobacter sp.]
MNHFEFGPQGLACEGVPLSKIAAEVGTPVYVYSRATLERHFTVFRDALVAAGVVDPLVAYAVKANSNIAVLKVLGDLGAGADTVSEGEIRRALAAGIPGERIVFSGVGKTRHEIAFALRTGVAEINVESEPELTLVAAVAAELGVRAKVAFRVNPDVSAGGHAKIATGKAENKFGVSFAEAARLYANASNNAALEPIGVACHIGSQITDLTPMRQAFSKMRGLVEQLLAEGLSVERLDLGGGLGVPYFNMPTPPSPADFAAMVGEVTKGLPVKLAFEPGRVIAANAGVLVSEVIHIHERPEGRRFLVIDAAMNDLIRPAMYDAFHDIRPLVPRAGEAVAYDVVGPICETGDTFTRDRPLPPLAAGDLVAFMS